MKRIKIVIFLLIILLIIFNVSCFNAKNQIPGTNSGKNDSVADINENTDKSKSDTPKGNDSKTGNNIQNNDANNNDSVKEHTSENIVFEKPVQNPLRTLPKLNIQIIEGPVILEDASLAYYRLSAKVSAYPGASLSFSKDDSFGAWGPNIVQINLLPEETYDLKVVSSNEIGTTSAVVRLDWMEAKINYTDIVIVNDEDNPVFYHIDVLLDEQKTRVYYKDELIREMICSTGAPDTPTPKGSFKTGDKIFYSWLPKYDVGAYYFVRFFNSYLFHSIPFDDEGNMIKEEFDNLGKASSHGCIRLGMEDAKWFYENLPPGISLEIR